MSKTYIITGAGHFPGLGANSAKYFLEKGHNVVVNSRSFDNDWDELNKLYNSNLRIVSGDINEDAVQDQLVDTAVNSFGGIDVLVNNAAPATKNNYNENITREDWATQYNLNVVVPFELSMKCEKHLRSSHGNIIMVGSRSGLVAPRPTPQDIAYGTSKAAMHHLTTCLSVFFSPDVRVNALVPSFFYSNRLVRDKSDEVINDISTRFNNRNLLKRSIDMDDLVKGIEFLAENNSITGQVLPICNGASVNFA